MPLTESEKKLIARIRKHRRIAFKTRTTIWGIMSIIFSFLAPLLYLFERTEYLCPILFFLLLSFALCSSSYLCNIIKEQDDELKRAIGQQS